MLQQKKLRQVFRVKPLACFVLALGAVSAWAQSVDGASILHEQKTSPDFSLEFEARPAMDGAAWPRRC